jgi:hypothetical protein
MRGILRHKWTLVSGPITVVHCLVIYGVIEYLYRRGLWHPDSYPASKSVVAMARVHSFGMLLADATAVVGIIVEKPPIYAIIALVLGLFSFFVFVG